MEDSHIAHGFFPAAAEVGLCAALKEGGSTVWGEDARICACIHPSSTNIYMQLYTTYLHNFTGVFLFFITL